MPPSWLPTGVAIWLPTSRPELGRCYARSRVVAAKARICNACGLFSGIMRFMP
jgi:hypothetical protein